MSRGGGAIIGVSDHGGWAVLVTVAEDGTLLDRRRVELVDKDLPYRHGEDADFETELALDRRIHEYATAGTTPAGPRLPI